MLTALAQMAMRSHRPRRHVVPPGPALAVALALAASPLAAQFNPEEQDQLLTAHDAVRAEVKPAAIPPLPDVAWNATLEGGAQGWANGCHGINHSLTPGVGENIYASGASFNPPPRPTVYAIVEDPTPANFSWGSEKSSYTYSTNGCSGVCGHYTQVVWRTSTSIGCGIKLCHSDTNPFPPPFNAFDWWVVVCQYSPQGNFIGQRPYLCNYGAGDVQCTGREFRNDYEQGLSLWSGHS